MSWLLLALADARAQTVPRRQIPDPVLTELSLLEQRFATALASDCHPELCYPKGCAYVDHAVVDRPRGGSMPGLGGDDGPGSVPAQEFLTRATCAFAYEPTVTPEDADALARRLQLRVSGGFVQVSVNRQALDPVPAALTAPPAPEVEEAPPPPPPADPEFTLALAVRELWTELLPHFAWMIAIGLLTSAATALFWAWRRVGRETIEERAMLAEIARDAAAPPAPPAPEPEPDDDGEDPLAAERAAWKARLAGAGADDPELQGLVAELLRDGDLPTLARVVLDAPVGLLGALPAGGDVAAAKLELADFLKRVTPEELPSDEAFFRALDRVSRAAAITLQTDARLLRSLREEFGAAGLAELCGRLPARAGALLFAHAPADTQLELVRLLPSQRLADLADQLVRSNRMDDAEADALFAVLRAARAGQPLPPVPTREVSALGPEIEATGPLSILLGALSDAERGEVLGDAADRLQGALPRWLRGVLWPELLLALPATARADLFLEVDADRLAAWLGAREEDVRARLVDGLPRALKASLGAAPPAASRERQLALAEDARRALAQGLQRRLARDGRTFEDLALGRGGPASEETDA